MSVTKELIEQEERLVQTGHVRELHLHKEGTFLRAYNWSAWLCCCYLHDAPLPSSGVGAGPVPARLPARARVAAVRQLQMERKCGPRAIRLAQGLPYILLICAYMNNNV